MEFINQLSSDFDKAGMPANWNFRNNVQGKMKYGQC